MDITRRFGRRGLGSNPGEGTIMKSQKILSTTILVFFFLLSVSQIWAAGTDCPKGIVPCGTELCPCGFCDFFKLFHNIINFLLLRIAPIIATLMLVIGGLFLLVARGNPELFSKAKSIITATIIGLVIMFVAWIFLNTFLDYLGVAEWTGLGTWWQMQCH